MAKSLIIFICLFVSVSYSVGRNARGCNTGMDCNRNQCCIANNRPIGKRAVFAMPWQGSCQPMGRVGSNCYITDFSQNREELLLTPSCPCKPAYTCQALPGNPTEVPYGTMGTCEWNAWGKSQLSTWFRIIQPAKNKRSSNIYPSSVLVENIDE